MTGLSSSSEASRQALTPLAIFVYNRPDHLRRLLQSLETNPEYQASPKYFFCDGPKSESDVEKTRSVRQMLAERSLDHAQIVTSDKNQGLATSLTSGVDHLFETGYNSVIVLEDDLEVSPVFLRFMNDILAVFADDPRYAGVSGYAYGSDVSPKGIYSLPVGCSWGWGTWKRVWEHSEFDAHVLLKQLAGRKSAFDFGGYPFHDMLQKQSMGQVDSWAVRFYASFFLQSQRFIYPPKNLVTNLGMDHSGTHTAESDYFKHRTIATDIKYDPACMNDASMERSVRDAFKKVHGSSTIFARVLKKARMLIGRKQRNEKNP